MKKVFTSMGKKPSHTSDDALSDDDEKTVSDISDMMHSLSSKSLSNLAYFSNNFLIMQGRVTNRIIMARIARMGKETTTSPVLHDDPLPGVGFFASVLAELDKFKEELGGAPVFGKRKPTINDRDSKVFMFGHPMSAVKDWISMTLKNEWKPKVFWRNLAKRYGVSDKQMSQYEEAHIIIQRFGLLIANKERFLNILDKQDASRYNELGQITGMAWHPDQNSASVEKECIEFIEQFLTVYFEQARQTASASPAAMIEYFQAFEGVCMEDRARSLYAYATKKPLADLSYELPADLDLNLNTDWNTAGTAENAFMKEATALFGQLAAPPTPEQLLAHLTEKRIFDLEFTTQAGSKSKPSLESFYTWAKEQVEACILDDFELPIPSFQAKKAPPVPPRTYRDRGVGLNRSILPKDIVIDGLGTVVHEYDGKGKLVEKLVWQGGDRYDPNDVYTIHGVRTSDSITISNATSSIQQYIKDTTDAWVPIQPQPTPGRGSGLYR